MSNEKKSGSSKKPYSYLWDSSAPFATTYSGIAHILWSESSYAVQSLFRGISHAIAMYRIDSDIRRIEASNQAKREYLRQLCYGSEPVDGKEERPNEN